MRLAAVSVDLDEIPCYAAIHGLDAAREGSAHVIYDACIARLEKLFADENVPCTFFVIGDDVEREENRTTLRRLHRAGHELANHSHHHLYDLTRRSRDEIQAEIEGGALLIETVCDERPVGFRAPGYTINDTVFEVLQELGYAYDSSVFPCPAYYSAKTAAIGLIGLRGRTSRSVVDDPRVLTASADPYRVGAPYWQRGTGLLELPIGVTSALTGRLPYIGTSIVLGGERAASMLSRAMIGRPLVNLELHGIDVADAKADGLTWLAPHQPDLRKSRDEKEAALRTAIRTLKRADYEFVTLIESTKRLSPSP